LGLEAQQASVQAFVAAQGWTLVAEYSDIVSGKDDRRPGFQAALARCRQLGSVLVAARLDRITRRAHTLSGLLEEGYQIHAADMPGADDLMMRIYAAMVQKERALISERTRAALRAAKARGAVLGSDRGYRLAEGPSAAAAAQARRVGAEWAAHRLALEIERQRAKGVTGQAVLALWGAATNDSASMHQRSRPLWPFARSSTTLLPGTTRIERMPRASRRLSHE
jgi:DNA invertase Pin-like site-specific DNA recombinase